MKALVEKIKATLLDEAKRNAWIQANKSNIGIYAAAFLAVFSVYHLLSDGDFSFMLTTGAMVRTLGFVVLASKSVTQKSVAGISLKTLQLYAVVFSLRLSSILFFEGYLPFDASGDWFYQVNEVIGLLCVLFIYASP